MKEAMKEYPGNTIDGIRIQFPNGWGLIRASNTQPALVMRFEADTSENLSRIEKTVRTKLSDIIRMHDKK
jgi:phosphomannomutase/phosphoglucomutase